MPYVRDPVTGKWVANAPTVSPSPAGAAAPAGATPPSSGRGEFAQSREWRNPRTVKAPTMPPAMPPASAADDAGKAAVSVKDRAAAFASGVREECSL